MDAAARQWHSRDHTYRFPRAMRPIIAALAHGTPLTIQDIVSSAGEELDEGAVRVLVAMLVRLDLAAIVM